jgi:hypothetical protein
MRDIRSSVLVLASIAVTFGLLTAAAAAPAPPDRKCYNEAGEEIPCPESNYLQTQKAIRDASRDSGPTFTPVPPTFTLTPTPEPTATPTTALVATETVATAAALGQPAQPPAAAPPEPASQPSAFMMLVPLAMFGFAGLIGVILLVLLVRWLLSRNRASHGPPTA